MRPAHIHFMIEAPGYRKLTTHVFVAGDEHLGDDAVFGVDDALVADFVAHAGGEVPPAGGPAGEPWSSLRYDFTLADDVSGAAVASGTELASARRLDVGDG